MLVALAIADVGWSRHSHEKSLKMSKQEIKEEHKQQDMAPEIKGRIRSKARGMSRAAHARADVKTADVIVTNPTHFAVALRYGRDAARRACVAKGADLLALRIRELAARARRRDRREPAARPRSSTAQVEVGQEIPAEMLRRRRRGARLRVPHEPPQADVRLDMSGRRPSTTATPGPLGKLLRYSDFVDGDRRRDGRRDDGAAAADAAARHAVTSTSRSR